MTPAACAADITALKALLTPRLFAHPRPMGFQ
jgi:hypothetical protein